MQSSPLNLVIRHRKENLKKCSLRHLEFRRDLRFLTYPFHQLPSLKNFVMLVMEGAPLLSDLDKEKGILLLDSTWRYLPKMEEAVSRYCQIEKRCLPGCFITAYPRNQNFCVDPSRGLASVEALYISYIILGRDVSGILDNYHWKDQFLKLNSL